MAAAANTNNVSEQENEVAERNNSFESVLSMADKLGVSESEEDEDVVVLKKPFKSKGLFSDSEEESKTETVSCSPSDNNEDKPDLITNVVDNVQNIPKKYLKLIDSEPESDNDTVEKDQNTSQAGLLDKNIDNEDKSGLIKQVDNVQNIPNNYLKLIDSESDESDNDTVEKGQNISQSDLLDKNSDDEGSHSILPETVVRPAKRDSAKTALDHIKAIKSETQRLARESHLSIPYHKPRSHTLKEFMNRKTISKPDSLQKTKSMRSSVKMSVEDLEKFAKHLEERAKEATEFFRSESDEERESKPEMSADSITKDQNLISLTEVSPSGDNINELANITEIASGEHSNIEHPELTQVDDEPKHLLNVENLKKMLDEQTISNQPMLKGDYNTLIDLESGDIVPKKPSGADNLLQKFLIHCNKRRSKAESNKEKSILASDIVTASSTPNDDETAEMKPGQALVKLKTELKKIITTKRKEELLKKIQDINEQNKVLGCNVDEDEDDEMDADSELEENYEVDEDIEEDEYENIFEDKEALDDSVHSDDDADDELDSDNEIDEECSKSKQRTRIVTKLVESDNESLSEFDNKIENDSERKTDNLWQNEDLNESGESENELMNLCTGQFNKSNCSDNIPETIESNNTLEISQIPTTGTNNFLISQLPSTQIGKDVDETELLGLCSGNFQDNNVKQSSRCSNESKRTMPSTSDEENSEDEIGTVKRNKRARQISISDDEEELNTEKCQDLESDSTVINEEVPDTYVDYDSEENEIEVKMTKSDWKRKATAFVENEAELSESEWGSADEDEKDLDRYDVELADEEEFDKDKLRSELERIHMRRVLDDDIRQVKKIQEILFEDEENDGVGRKRQFKWKNADNNFNLDQQPDKEENKGNCEGSDGENEELWRKMRHERETILTEKGIDIKSLSNSNTPNTELSKRKINILKKENRNSNSSNTSSPFLIVKGKQFSEARGSFLVRDKETLSKLAMLTKTTITESEGIVSTVQMSSSKARNFVFAAVNPEPANQQNIKRKSDDMQSIKDTDIQENKKQRLNSTPRPIKQRLLDHL